MLFCAAPQCREMTPPSSTAFESSSELLRRGNCRKMTDAERRTLETAKELIQQRQGTKHSEKAAT
jgi:hypothetical protein